MNCVKDWIIMSLMIYSTPGPYAAVLLIAFNKIILLKVKVKGRVYSHPAKAF